MRIKFIQSIVLAGLLANSAFVRLFQCRAQEMTSSAEVLIQ